MEDDERRKENDATQATNVDEVPACWAEVMEGGLRWRGVGGRRAGAST